MQIKQVYQFIVFVNTTVKDSKVELTNIQSDKFKRIKIISEEQLNLMQMQFVMKIFAQIVSDECALL